MFNWFLSIVVVFGCAKAWSQDYMMCGPKPGLIERLITDAEEIRKKCMEQVYEENQKKVREEVAALNDVRIKLDEEIKKTAISMTISTVQCAPSNGQTRNPTLVKRCQDAVKSKQGVIARIDKLMGWKNEQIRPAQANNQTPRDPSQFPCPTQAQLNELKVARAFNARLNEMWTRCMIDG